MIRRFVATDAARVHARTRAPLYAFFLAAAFALALARGRDVDASAPGRSSALRAVLATRGLIADPGDMIWLRTDEGTWGAIFGGARALVRANARGEPADLYLVAARLSAEGSLLAVGGSWNLTRTTDADETAPVQRGTLAAYATQVDGLFTAVHVLDLARARPATDLTRLQRWQTALTDLQTSGQLGGVNHDIYALDSAATRLTLDFDGDQLVVQADERRYLIDVRAQTVRGSESGHGGMTVSAEERARPGNLVTWSVDRVRAMPWFGDDKMQTIKAIAFTGLDWILRTRERLVGDEGAKEVAEDLAGVNIGREQPTFEDAEIGWPPPPLEVVLKAPLPNEGRWIVLDKDPFITKTPGVPGAFATSFLRTDKQRPQSRVYITLWDPRQIALHMVAGTVEPVSATGAAGPGVIPRTPEVIRHVVGGFNGGFQAIHGEYGMEADGVVYLPPKPYAATVLELADGTTGFGSWPGSPDIPADVLSYRQNMTALVQMDKFNPWGRVWWGGTPPGWADNIHTTRSGLCLTKENFVAYFYGLDMSAEALATGMLHARCAYGVHLDMNPGLVGFEFYDVEPKDSYQPLGRPLQTDWEWEGSLKDLPDLTIRARRMIKGMGHVNFPQYIHRDGRDFFYLTARAELPGPDLAAGPTPAQPGEGTWRVKGLPQHGFPYAVAITEVRPDAAHPEIKLRALRLDPRAVRASGAGGSEGATGAGEASDSVVATFRAAASRPGQVTLWLGDGHVSLAEAASEAGAVPLVSGWSLATLPAHPSTAVAELPRAALGIRDDDGMLQWLELAPEVVPDGSTAALLDAALARSGCAARMILPPSAAAMLGADLDLTLSSRTPRPAGSTNADAAAAVRGPLLTTTLVRRQTPSARDYFPTTPIVSPSVWQPLQSQRVRYFPKKKKKLEDAGAGPPAEGDGIPSPEPADPGSAATSGETTR